jgi:vacuolar-type H+-ATPase subunit E/Vma4
MSMVEENRRIRVKIDLKAGLIEAEGSDEFVKTVYEDFRERLKAYATTAGEDLRELLSDAQAAYGWGEYARAQALYAHALEQAPRGLDNPTLAEILEGLESENAR